MLAASFGMTFFLKTPRKETDSRIIYLRITVDGITKETSTKHRWDAERWDQKKERAIGNKEDARTTNFFLEAIEMKVQQYRNELMYGGQVISSEKLMDHVLGRGACRATILQEFQLHNDQLLALVERGEYAIGTHVRFEIAKKHVKEYVAYKYKLDDMEFRDLNFEFVKDYEFYLKTVKKISHNTALKYITNFKKIVLLAIDKEIISIDPFRRFKAKKVKVHKMPLTSQELSLLENHSFSIPRLNAVRDIFVFQCYTGLAYIDAFNLKKSDIMPGIDGEIWIISERQKTGGSINIPLLPKAIGIIERYREHPICLQRNSVLPVTSNQKMNEYLKEIGTLCGITTSLNTHRARRTFGSTVTLNNDVPIHIVKELLGHQSVKQTEEYAITEQRSVGREMKQLHQRLNIKETPSEQPASDALNKMQQEIQELRELLALSQPNRNLQKA